MDNVLHEAEPDKRTYNPLRLKRRALGRKHIPDGHWYIAGDSKWNPYHPTHAGADAVVLITESERARFAAQGYEFHMFAKCGTKKTQPSYMGPDAVDKFLYHGVHKFDGVSTEIPFGEVSRGWASLVALVCACPSF